VGPRPRGGSWRPHVFRPGLLPRGQRARTVTGPTVASLRPAPSLWWRAGAPPSACHARPEQGRFAPGPPPPPPDRRTRSSSRRPSPPPAETGPTRGRRARVACVPDGDGPGRTYEPPTGAPFVAPSVSLETSFPLRLRLAMEDNV
jgi:hypothetical protein